MDVSPTAARSSPRLHIAQRIDAEAVRQLQESFDVTLGFGPEPVALERAAPELDALVVRDLRVPNEVLEASSQLRVVVRAGIGLDGIDLGRAAVLGIQVVNTPGTNARTVAEHTLALALAATRGVVRWDALTRQGFAERRDEAPARELCGRTWGVLGYGRIGREVAAIAREGLRMRVLTTRRAGSHQDGVAVVDDLDELLAASDVVSLHVPLTVQTAGLIGARELRLMRTDAVLVNVARGLVVDGTALVDALERGEIGAAAVDVWDRPFPDPPDPLYDVPNLVLSPHRAGRTVEADQATGRAVVQEIRAAFSEASSRS